MEHGHDFTNLTAEDARQALQLLGITSDEGAPDDPDVRASGYLAMILAAAQAHLQTRRRHADLIGEAYHAAFEHFTGRCPDHVMGEPDDEFHRNGR